MSFPPPMCFSVNKSSRGWDPAERLGTLGEEPLNPSSFTGAMVSVDSIQAPDTESRGYINKKENGTYRVCVCVFQGEEEQPSSEAGSPDVEKEHLQVR